MMSNIKAIAIIQHFLSKIIYLGFDRCIYLVLIKERLILKQHTQQVQSVAFNFDGTKLASGSDRL